jgi:xanthine dehydrogenase YagS FAD-binding subunit
MAVALLAYDARITTGTPRWLDDRRTDWRGSNGCADHSLLPGEMITKIVLPASPTGERAA